MQKYVKKFGDERLTKVPVDLDTKPYRDEHDTDLLNRMEKCAKLGNLPPGVDATSLRRAIRKTMTERHSAKGVALRSLRTGFQSAEGRAARASDRRHPIAK
jgi:hypothetical protein